MDVLEKYKERLAILKENRAETVDTNTDVENDAFDREIRQVAEFISDMKQALDLAGVTARFPSKFDFKGWADMDCEMPKKEGNYLCLIKWVGQENYEYEVVPFSKEEGFHLYPPKVDHVLWTHLPPMPFSNAL